MAKVQNNKQQEEFEFSVQRPTKSEKFIALIFYLPTLLVPLDFFGLVNMNYILPQLNNLGDWVIIAIFIIWIALPYIIAIVIWFVIRKRSTFINEVGKAAFNFGFSFLFWLTIMILSIFAVMVILNRNYHADANLLSILIGILFLFFVLPFCLLIIFGMTIAGIIMTLQGIVPKFPLLFKFFKYKN
ncbi:MULTISPECIES: DUF4870 domain-containing protein [Staphylococcus]|uniref:DUF4870 domain-containing protein n=1 Tax=Staphylococcus pettenkoferi TaxID=170573 RepID=A0A2N6QEM1_9STAP|nr:MULTISPECIES: DUF4870 domain-containing protein [Staphylococcus]MBX8993959.1 DUF4870 domain-containing protein [Staphylococcus pettenkoferi]MCI2791840.1 DUF4870 domain-containing protein [Staphylococcus pettenkoferi]MCY1568029.1 DUF4870 domain-containing protein [Staphylococcus pettenkoferi]MCY1604159.1 DUF4870 domain-containing protein [Staphylococcus pettenkoferi]OFK77880.1 hypothetical protein HMPREF2802_02705 [Staphylococcus sp. HMSC071G07]